MCYAIREQICLGVWPKPKGFESKGYAKNLQIKSKCVDASKFGSVCTCIRHLVKFNIFLAFFIMFAGLVIDGSIAYPFNDGAKVLLEVHPEDALLTVALKDR